MVWAFFVIVALAVSRATRLIVADRIFLFLRRWVVDKWGDESSAAYLVHCRACASIWLAFPAAIGWTLLSLPWHSWWVALPAWLALSQLTILVSRLEEQE